MTSGADGPTDTTEVVHDEVGRPEPPVGVGEFDTLTGFLEFLRATLEWKTRDLDEVGLRATTAASSMTLGGLLKHLAWVEDYWFRRRLLGAEPAEPWASVDWEADRDWEWTSSGSDSADDLRTLWTDAVERSREAVEQVMTGDGLDHPTTPWPDGSAPTLRWVLVHMIEEYARHAGHADLLREAVDGQVGE